MQTGQAKRGGSPPAKRTYSLPNHIPESALLQGQRNLKCRLKRLAEARVLSDSLRPKDRSSHFQHLEFYGDAVLELGVTKKLLNTLSCYNPYFLSTVRVAVVRNTNLARFYDSLELDELLEPRHRPDTMKDRADIVEAIIGELETAREKEERKSKADEIHDMLDKLICAILFMGEREVMSAKTDSDVSGSQAGASAAATTAAASVTTTTMAVAGRRAPDSRQFQRRSSDKAAALAAAAAATTTTTTPVRVLRRRQGTGGESDADSPSAPSTHEQGQRQHPVSSGAAWTSAAASAAPVAGGGGGGGAVVVGRGASPNGLLPPQAFNVAPWFAAPAAVAVGVPTGGAGAANVPMQTSTMGLVNFAPQRVGQRLVTDYAAT